MSSFRVFISSTFTNFEFERNYLAQNLYPSLDASCRKNGYAFHAIDLRWGISTEASLDNKSMLLCLDEIKKCQQTEIKPNFLIMLGDYYGWMPLPFTIEESEANTIFTALDDDSKALFERCYKLDTNNIPCEYVLQGRQGNLVDNNVWSKTEEKLHKALEKAARATLADDKLGKYIYSATHQEIIHGFLNDDVIKDSTFVFIKDEGNIYNNDEDYLNAKRLKDKILSFLPENQYARFSNKEEFISAVEKAHAFLQGTISVQTEQLAKTDKQISFLSGLRDNYIPNEELENEIINSIEGKTKQKIFILGDKYEGKTSLMIDLYYKLNTSQDRKIHLWSANSDHEHLSVLDLCRFIIKKCTKNTKNPFIEYDTACYFVQKTIFEQGYNESTNIFLIDGIEDLNDFHRIGNAFYQISLTKNVIFVLTGPNECLLHEGLHFLLPAFSEAKREELFNTLLSSSNRTMTDDQRKSIMPIVRKGNPLFVRFLASKIKNTHSYDAIDKDISSMDTFVKSEIKYLSKPTMYGEILVSRILLFLAFSPYGISETEMLDLLKHDDEVVSFLKYTANWSFDESFGIPKVVLYRIMADIGAYVLELNDKGDIVYKLNSSYLADVILSTYSDEKINSLYKFYKEYFKGRNIYINSKKEIDTRIARQWLYITTKEDSELAIGLESLAFCDACIKLDEIELLIDSYKRLNLTDSPIYKVIIKNFNQLLVFPNMFLTYAFTEGLVNSQKLKRVEINYADNAPQKATNWMNDKLEFCYMLNEDEYIISYENSLVKINKKTNDIVKRLTFNSQILKCCISNDKNELLIVCGDSATFNSVLNLYIINLETFSLTDCITHNIVIQDYILCSSCRVFASKENFVVAFSCNLKEAIRETHYFYSVSKDACENLFTMKSLLSCTFAMVSEKYILIRQGLKTFNVLDLEKKQIVSKTKRLSHLKFYTLDNSFVADNGNTYVAVYGRGLYRLYIKNGKIKVKREFLLFSKSEINNPKFHFLKHCFLMKEDDSEYTDIYTYDGMYIGKCRWDDSDYVLDVCGSKVYFVDIGGRFYEKEIDTSITFNQKKIDLSPLEFWVENNALKQLPNAFNGYMSPENRKKVYSLSCDGKYTACLSRDGLTVKAQDDVVFEYLYKSKRPLARSIHFLSSDLLLWKQSHKSFKLIDFSKKEMKTLISLRHKAFDCTIIENSLYISNCRHISWRRIKDGNVPNAITKITVLPNGEILTQCLDLNYNKNPIDILKKARKSNEAKIVFSYSIPSALQFANLSNDQIICLSNDYIVRILNQRIFFYSYNDEKIRSYFSYSNLESDNKSKIFVHDDVYYSYLEPLKTVLIYNKDARQIISYLVDDSVCDVAFDKNAVRLLHTNGKIDVIDII